MEKKRNINILPNKLAVILTMSVFLCCTTSTSFANNSSDQFSYIRVNSHQTQTLRNPLYLDNTRATKPVIKTKKLYTGEFQESDYFSSFIDEENSPTSQKSDLLPNFNQIPSLVEIKTPEINEETIKTDITPSSSKNESFFTPPNNIVEQDVTPNLSPNTTIEKRQEIVQENNVYSAKLIDSNTIEGRVINRIYFAGLETVHPNVIKEKIKTQTGSLYNEERLQQDLQNIYDIGFFTDTISIEPIINEDGSVDLKFVLEENIIVKDISIMGNGVISAMELMPLISPLKDLPQNINKINDSIDKINNYYHSKGYILAKVTSIDDTHSGCLIFNINEGIIDKILIDGNKKTKNYVIERNIMTQPNTVYNENYLKDDLSRIFSTKIFKEVNREIYPSETDENKYNVKVIVEEDSPNNLALGGGVDNGLGAFGSVSYSENNLLGKGQKLSLSGIIGSGILLSDASISDRMNYQVELNFFEPYFLNADNSLRSKLYYRDLGSWQVPLAVERRFGVNTVIEHKLRNHEHLTTNLGLGLENINLKEGDFNKISQLYELRNLDISNRARELTGGTFINISPGIRYANVDSLENPRNGVIASAKFMEAFSLSDFKNTNGRLAGGVTKYFPVREKSTFSISAKGGIKVHGEEMPEVMAFQLGGPYSLRGFRMSGVGTGDAFLMSSAELATPLPFVDRLKWDFLQRIRLTFFVDAGKVFDPTVSSVLFDRPMSAIVAGIGLKVNIPSIGPISLDYGLPLTNTGEFGSQHGYFTFGTYGMNPYNW